MKDIKLAAGKGDQITVKTLAKSLVRLRQQVGKLTASEALMRGVGTNLTVRCFTLGNRQCGKTLVLFCLTAGYGHELMRLRRQQRQRRRSPARCSQHQGSWQP